MSREIDERDCQHGLADTMSAQAERIAELEAALAAERAAREAAEQRANVRHGTIAKAVYETVQDHAATWDTASDALIWEDPAVDVATQKHWKVSDSWLAECCTRFPQWAEQLRSFAEQWNSDEPLTDEMLEVVQVEDEVIERGTRRAMQIMRFYRTLRETEERAEQAERDRDAAADLAREECAKHCESHARTDQSVTHTAFNHLLMEARELRATITDPAAVKRTLEDAARYKARRHAIYLARIRYQISLPKPSEDEFNAEYDAGCDKERDGYIVDHRGVYVKSASKGEEGKS